MKSNLLSILAFVLLLPFAGLSQQRESPCNLLPHAVFKGTTNVKPHNLRILGTSPQFGEIPQHNAKSAYDHLKSVYTRNFRGSKKEIDELLVALGYTGFRDPAFGVNSITPETLPAGTTGWMGAYSHKHKYVWSTLGRDFPTFKIAAKEGSCFLYIMKKCGNAFYVPVTCEPGVIKPGCPCVDGYPTANCHCVPGSSANSYLPQVVCEPTTTCQQQSVTVSGSGQIQGGDVLNASKNMELVAVNAAAKDKGLCLGTYPVTYRSTYNYTMNGTMQYAKTIPVCMEGTAMPAPMNLVMPLNLDYKITKQDVKIGEGDRILLTVSNEQYKAMSKAYKACATANSTMASTSEASSISRKVLSETPNDVSFAGGTKCADQKINFIGRTQIQDGSVKGLTQEVTMIGVYKKTGKLQKGELPEKYLCLGTFPVPVRSSFETLNNGGATVSKLFKVCNTDGMAGAEQNINIPVNMTYNFTKQDVMLGDYNKVYVALDEKQYNALSKSYSRCCSNGKIGPCGGK